MKYSDCPFDPHSQIFPYASQSRVDQNVVVILQVPQEHIILINLFCTPSAAQLIVQSFPNLNVLTTELHEVTPNHFGERYFGTEHSEYEQF